MYINIQRFKCFNHPCFFFVSFNLPINIYDIVKQVDFSEDYDDEVYEEATEG